MGFAGEWLCRFCFYIVEVYFRCFARALYRLGFSTHLRPQPQEVPSSKKPQRSHPPVHALRT